MYPSLSRKARENAVLRFQKRPHPPKRITPPPAAAAFAGKQPASAFCYASRSIFPLRAKLLPMLTEDALHELFATNHQAVAEVAHYQPNQFKGRKLPSSPPTPFWTRQHSHRLMPKNSPKKWLTNVSHLHAKKIRGFL